jgi:hypothetical protein
MWHWLASTSNGADQAAPLLISGLRLRFHYKGIPVEEKDLVGKLDTAASMTAIPIRIAIAMKLPSAGMEKNLQSFDLSIKLPAYPKFYTELFIPKWGWRIMPVVGCHRDNVLLGRDICNKMLLVANWRCRGFGLKHASFLNYNLRFLFSRVGREVQP